MWLHYNWLSNWQTSEVLPIIIDLESVPSWSFNTLVQFDGFKVVFVCAMKHRKCQKEEFANNLNSLQQKSV